MRIQGLWAIRLVSIGILATAACSAPDPGVGNLGSSHNNNNTVGDSGTGGNNTPKDSGSTNTGGIDSGGSTDIDSGSGGGTDAGSDTGTPVPVTAFSGAGPYASSPVMAADSASTKHTVAAQGFTNPAGKDCMTCHSAGGTGPQFAFGGTAYTSAAGTTPAPDVEVRVVDSAGKEQGTTHSDADGNFWVESTTALPATAITGARNATVTNKMVSNATAGCNTCHAPGGATGAVHVP